MPKAINTDLVVSWWREVKEVTGENWLMRCLPEHAKRLERIITAISRWRTSQRFINILFIPKLFNKQKTTLVLARCVTLHRMSEMDGWVELYSNKTGQQELSKLLLRRVKLSLHIWDITTTAASSNTTTVPHLFSVCFLQPIDAKWNQENNVRLLLVWHLHYIMQ